MLINLPRLSLPHLSSPGIHPPRVKLPRAHLPHASMPRLKVRAARTRVDRGPAIGDADSHVFSCPGCNRPLPNGTFRCTGCGIRLVLGVKVRRAAGILGIGVIVGVLAAGIIGLTLTGWMQPSGGIAAVPGTTGATGAQPSGAAASSAAPALPPNVPRTAVGALGGTAVINKRILADAAVLSKTLAKSGDAVAIARNLRTLAADAAQGIDMTGRMAGWTDAAAVRKQLNALYGLMADTAHDGLQASLTNKNAYRATAKKMLADVKTVAAVDAASRVLAGTVSVQLPLIGLPGEKAPSPSTAP
jgi:hypothetical protein